MNARWKFPDESRFRPPYPLAFFVLTDPARAGAFENSLAKEGIATFQFPFKPGFPLEDILALYRTAIDHERIDREHVGLLGENEGADLIGKDYYRFYSVLFPKAIVLISPTLSTYHLNLITCPYLIVHESPDPHFYEAVMHHQYRYGDATLLVFDVEPVCSWLKKAIIEGLRPQEPAPPAAA